MGNEISTINNNTLPPVKELTTFDIFTNPQVYQMCEVLARSNYVPDEFKGKPEDVMAALNIALTHHMDTFTVMQNLQMVKGHARWKSDYTIGAINASGLYSSRLSFDMKYNDKGEVISCQAWAIDARTGEKRTGSPITWDMVTGEGWDRDKPMKTGGVQISKWKTMREQMFKYRAAAFFVRTNCPEVLMGYYTADEGEDIPDNKPIMEYADKTEPAPEAPKPVEEPAPEPQYSPKQTLYIRACREVGKDAAAEVCTAALNAVGLTSAELTDENLSEVMAALVRIVLDRKNEENKVAEGTMGVEEPF